MKKLIAVDSQREILSRLLVEQYLNRQEMNLALEEILQLCSVANVEELEESEPGKLSLRRDRWLVAHACKLPAKKLMLSLWKSFIKIYKHV